MKLAVAVTYIVDENHGALLDLHLDRIARHTTVPWTIYGSVNRLLPKFRERLEREPRARLFELPPTAERGMQEHSWYLEQLFDAALSDGATHVAVLHVDSFPIADGWAEAMASHLAGDAAFVTGDHITTACLLFPREFRETHRARLLWPDDRSTPEWKAYLREKNPVEHSGIGYGFAAHRAGLRWHAMRETGQRSAGAATIFDDAVLHVQGALRLAPYAGTSTPVLRRVGRARADALATAGRRVVRALRDATPAALRPLVRRVVPVRVDDKVLFDASRRLEADRMSAALERLLADPDRTIEEWR